MQLGQEVGTREIVVLRTLDYHVTICMISSQFEEEALSCKQIYDKVSSSSKKKKLIHQKELFPPPVLIEIRWRNEALKRPSPDMRDQNLSKRKTMEGNHVQMLPGSKFCVSKRSAFHVFQSTKQDSGKNPVLASDQGHKFMGDASGVDAESSRGGDVAQMETHLREKLLSSSDVVDLKYAVPDLNETASETEPEPESSGDDDKGSTFLNVSSSMADLEVVVKIIREMEIKGHLKTEFRLKFLTWYSLRATEKEREVVCAYMRSINNLSSLAGQLVDSFSYIMPMGP